MGTVELVLRREGDFRRLYARKRPHEQHERSASFRAHFLREARVAGLLRHPNVVSVLDVGEDPEGPYLVMDFVEGISLAQLIGRFRAEGELIPLQVCLAITRHVADGLHAAHELRDHDGSPIALVHRDVSPQNILIDYEGIARVTDFGLAKALGADASDSSSDALKGKIGYMSPEQLRFEPLDRRSDLWALGVVLYETLACERLHTVGGGVDRVARQILDAPPPDIGAVRDDAPPALTELLFDLLAKERGDRPATASEVSRRIGEILREVEREDGAIELGDFIEEHFGEDRAARRSRRAAAIAEAEARPSPTPSRAPRLIGATVAAAVALIAAGWGAYAWVVAPAETPTSDRPAASASRAETPATPEPAAARDVPPEMTEGGAPVVEAASSAPPAEAVEPTEVADPEARPAAPGAASGARRRSRRGARDRLWEWP